MATLTAGNIVDIAATTNASTFGLSAAAAAFKAELAATISVTAMLTPEQQRTLENKLDFPVRCTKTHPVTHDHPILYALREVTRAIYDRLATPRQTKLRTLVVGSAEREVANYQANPYVHYYFHGSESKDYTRTIKNLLQRIVERAAIKSKSSRYTTRDDYGNRREAYNLRFSEAREIYDAYCTLHRMPSNMHDVIDDKYEVLLFEDSFYNFDVDAYFSVFDQTGANVAYGYGLLPMEFMFPKMAENRMYRLREHHDETSFTYTNGAYCNGYQHKTKAWKTLLESPVMNKRGHGYALVVEIVARAGPFAVFSITRTTANEAVVREISLPDRDCYVEVLDIFNCLDRNTGEVTLPLRYFSIRSDEWFTALNYALAIDEKALTLCNIMTMVRKRGGGVALATQQLVPAWDLPVSYYFKLSQIVYLQAKVVRGLSDDINISPARDSIIQSMLQSMKTTPPRSAIRINTSIYFM